MEELKPGAEEAPKSTTPSVTSGDFDEKSASDILAGMDGAFAASVQRNNKQIRADRGLMIVEESKLIHKRAIEDTESKITRLKRQLIALTDISPTSRDSLNFNDFDANKFVSDSLELRLQIRNEKVKLAEYQKEFNRLYGMTYHKIEEVA